MNPGILPYLQGTPKAINYYQKEFYRKCGKFPGAAS